MSEIHETVDATVDVQVTIAGVVYNLVRADVPATPSEPATPAEPEAPAQPADPGAGEAQPETPATPTDPGATPDANPGGETPAA